MNNKGYCVLFPGETVMWCHVYCIPSRKMWVLMFQMFHVFSLLEFSTVSPQRESLCLWCFISLMLWSLTEETLALHMEEIMLSHLDSLLSFSKYDLSYIESLQDGWWGRPVGCLYVSRASGPPTPAEHEENSCHNYSNPPVTQIYKINNYHYFCYNNYYYYYFLKLTFNSNGTHQQ